MTTGIVPGNNTFALATSIAGTSGQIGGNSTNATGEAGEPSINGEGSNSLWWQFTAPRDGRMSIILANNTCLTALRVFSGPRVSALSEAAGFGASRSGFWVQEGETYSVQMGGAFGTRGSGTYKWTFTPSATAAPTPTPTPVPTPTPKPVAMPGVLGNDTFAQATIINGRGGLISGDTAIASGEDGEPSINGEGSDSVWWRFTAPSDGRLSINLQSNTCLTALRAFTGSRVSALTEAASFGGVRGFNVTASTTYFIQMGGAFGARGQATYTWSYTADVAALPAPARSRLAGLTHLAAWNMNVVTNESTPMQNAKFDGARRAVLLQRRVRFAYEPTLAARVKTPYVLPTHTESQRWRI